jgi:hypothetical protein
MYTIGPPDDLDVAVVSLGSSQVAALQGLVFIPEWYVEAEDEQAIESGDEFVVFGFPDSNSRFRPDRQSRNITQKSFYFRTTAAAHDIATRENVSTDTHLLLEFDPKQITVQGERHTPPNPRGISGGGAFHVTHGKVKLAGIMTEHRKASRVMVAVRMREVVAIAEHVIQQAQVTGDVW